MRVHKRHIGFLLVMVSLLLTGCAPALIGGAAVTGGAGTYIFINGELKTDYAHPFDRVWAACEKTVAEMNSVDVVPDKHISSGTIEAVIDGEKVRFSVDYKAKDLTSVGIRVGLVGDRKSSQLLHDKVFSYLRS